MPDPLVLSHTEDGVTTLTMNNPARLNGWTGPMMAALRESLSVAARDEATRALILTGADPYYCAGVDLSAAFKLAHPKTLHASIVAANQALFDMFLDFPKPILVAVNGPVLGASLTSATLCDGMIASEKATFSTPFAAIGAAPEGCSSVMFPRLMGDAAERMLGEEGWRPTAAEALAVGLVQWVVPHEALMPEARRIAREWVESGAKRSFRGGFELATLKAVNARESVTIADAFLHPRFLSGRFRFFWKKGKYSLALMFLMLRITHPLWSLML